MNSMFCSSPQCALDTSYWTGFNHFVIWGSIIYYFCFHLAFYSDAIRYKYQGVAMKVFSLPKFWLCMVLTSMLLILPMVAFRFYKTNVTPTLSDKVRLKQRIKKSKSRPQMPHLRRASTIRRSTRSMRSGYAFSHQSGFGQLITSGLNMRERVRTPINVVLTKMTNWADSMHNNDAGTSVSTHEPKSRKNSASSAKRSPTRSGMPPTPKFSFSSDLTLKPPNAGKNIQSEEVQSSSSRDSSGSSKDNHKTDTKNEDTVDSASSTSSVKTESKVDYMPPQVESDQIVFVERL